MKKIFIISLLQLTCFSISAQSLQRSVIGAAGHTSSTGGFTLRATSGESVAAKVSNGSFKLHQGFHQWITANIPLPVIGMEFYARRISNTQVQLDWKTIQEINNNGFHIERKKENESRFTDIGFIASAVSGGNSSFPLQYQKTDNNSYTGKTFYRIKQEDIDGRSTYSVIRIVNGDVSNQLVMQVWPVPAAGFFNVNVSGLTKTEMIQVLDMNGRLVKQLAIQNNTQQQINGLPAGTYYLKLVSDKTVGQKVIIQ